MNYQDMTDFEVNCAVAKAIGFEEVMFFEVDSSICNGPVWTIASGWTDCGIPVSKGNPFDPCNSWADTGPILEENGITIIMDHPSMPLATNNCVGWYSDEVKPFHHANENPRRAGLVVFLMMKGGE